MIRKESNLQTKILTFLKRQPSVVYAVKMPSEYISIPNATSDILFLLDGGGWGFIEVKKEYPYKRNGDAKAGAFRPGQQEFVAKMKDHYWACVCWPENWSEVKEELLKII